MLFRSLIFQKSLYAQSGLYLRDTSVKVYAYSSEKSLAWCGGFNNSQFSVGDLNHDGLNDLIVFDICGNHYRLITYITFKKQIYYIKQILTHTKYDKGRWKK